MKREERHKLKENELAQRVAQAQHSFETHKGNVAKWAAALVVLLLLVGGFAWWRSARSAAGNDLLGAALAVYQAPVVPAPAPAPGSPAPVQQPGTFGTEQDKLAAALPKFVETIDRHPNSDAGTTARYHVAGILATLGRYPEAEQRYQEVIAKAGSGLYGRSARLGLADVQLAQKKYDNAITVYSELSRDTSSQLPMDGILMQLGRACAQAGRKEEALRAFTRVVDEFPQSLYASDAKRELEEARKS